MLTGEDDAAFCLKDLEEAFITRSESRTTTTGPFLQAPIDSDRILAKSHFREGLGYSFSPAS